MAIDNKNISLIRAFHFVSPVYLETELAWYILATPSPHYKPSFQSFYTPRRAAQIAISSAMTRPEITYEEFVHSFVQKVDIFGRMHHEGDIQEAVSHFTGKFTARTMKLII